MKKKYGAEFGINMLSGPSYILQQTDFRLLADHFEGKPPALHLYMICTRPRVTLDPTPFVVTDTTISGVIRVHSGSEAKTIPYTTRNLLGRTDVSFRCPYPHNHCEIITSDGKVISGGKTALVIAQFGKEYWPLLDLKVQYVGQAFGENGERLAMDRLASHSTLQAIYADVLSRDPSTDVWLTLWGFDQQLITMVGGFGPTGVEVTDEEDDAHIDKVTQATIPEGQLINLTEAALIKYFQPAYNTTYRDTFPHPTHTSYRECYDLDLNTISVELQTHKIMARVYSDSVEPSLLHFARFPLHSRKQRVAMFDFLKL